MMDAKPPVKRRAPSKPKVVVPAGPSPELILAVDALRSVSLTAHKANHETSYGKCSDMYCARARVLWEEIGGVEAVTAGMPAAEAWLAEKVIAKTALAEGAKVDGPEFTKTGKRFEGEVKPDAPPMVIANINESRKDKDDPGIPRDWTRIDPNAPEKF